MCNALLSGHIGVNENSIQLIFINTDTFNMCVTLCNE